MVKIREMRIYEFALVLKESTGKDEAKAIKLVSDLVASVKGKITKTNIIGGKQLAYPIKKQTLGWYGIFTVTLPEEACPELDKLVKTKEEILRYLLVRVEEE